MPTNKPEPNPSGEIILYQTEDGRTRLEVRLENETVWLTQKLMAELFQKDVRTINEHLQNVFEEGELAADSDRILPGDGDFFLSAIVEHLRRIGYPGYVSLELMNPLLWQIPPRQFGEIAITALRKNLGLASMS